MAGAIAEKDVEFIGQILTAQITATHRVSNRISDMGWTAAAEWAERFADLFDAVESVNDSLRVNRALMRHGLARGDVESAVSHYGAMKISDMP